MSHISETCIHEKAWHQIKVKPTPEKNIASWKKERQHYIWVFQKLRPGVPKFLKSRSIWKFLYKMCIEQTFDKHYIVDVQIFLWNPVDLKKEKNSGTQRKLAWREKDYTVDVWVLQKWCAGLPKILKSRLLLKFLHKNDYRADFWEVLHRRRLGLPLESSWWARGAAPWKYCRWTQGAKSCPYFSPSLPNTPWVLPKKFSKVRSLVILNRKLMSEPTFENI